MKTYLDCIPCFFKQTLESARMMGMDEKTQKNIMDDLCRMFPDFSMTLSPPEIARIIHKRIKELVGFDDPYINVKKASNDFALSVYDQLLKKIKSADDSLIMALKLAIAGNIIDFGTNKQLDVGKEIDNILNLKYDQSLQDQKGFDFASFKETLIKSEKILYLADNAGEIVFDKLLISEIQSLFPDKEILFAVKESPIINDATIDDAKYIGLDKMVKVISSGSDAPGTPLSLCTDEFKEIFRNIDMIISKGQGNFETLSHEKRRIFFLFMVKCPVVSRDVAIELGNIVLLDSASRK